jgi:hypothetical protein
MGTIITKKYSHLAEKRGLDRLFHLSLAFFPLVKDVIKSGKLREISSFAIWEVEHKLGVLDASKPIKFEEKEPFYLRKGMDIESLDFSDFCMKMPFTIQKIRNWKVFHRDSKGTIYGCLASENSVVYKSEDNGETLKRVATFDKEIKAVFISQEDVIFVNTKGMIYRSEDGEHFEASLALSKADSSIFHHYGMTQIPSGELLVGEYGNVPEDGAWANIAYLYGSSDLGKSWERSDFLKKQGVNKHIHMIKYSKILDRVVLADGDNKKQLWVSKDLKKFIFSENPWELRTHFHLQMGGYTSMVEIGDTLLFGTDYLGGTNFLVESRDGKRFDKKVIPDPYRRSPVHDLIKRTVEGREEIWAVLNNPNSSSVKSLLMVSMNGGESWQRVVEYSGREHLIMINSGDLKDTDTISFALTAMVEGGGEKGVCYEISTKASL